MDPVIPQILAAIGLLVIPSIGLTARFAARPIVDAIVRLRDAFPPQAPGVLPQHEQRLAALEEEVRQLRDGYERLASAVEFDAQLRAGTTPRPGLPPTK